MAWGPLGPVRKQPVRAPRMGLGHGLDLQALMNYRVRPVVNDAAEGDEQDKRTPEEKADDRDERDRLDHLRREGAPEVLPDKAD